MSKNEQQTDFQKALELLPWYAKNELSGEDFSWVEGQLDSSLELQEELALINKQIGLTEQYVESLDTESFENQASRINALKNRIKIQNNIQDIKNIEQEKFKPVNSTENQPKGGNSMWDKILSFLPRTQKQWQIASAVALSVMVIQGVIIAQLSKPNEVEYTTLSGVNTPMTGIVLLANFKSGTSLAQMELFLNKNNLKVIGGPDLERQYRLGFKRSVVKGKPLNDEEVSNLIFDLLDSKVVDFILREN